MVVEKRFNFYTEEETKKIIISAVDEAEKGARARLFPNEKIERLVREITGTPFGYAEGDGGHVARSYWDKAETTYLFVSWYTWRFRKHIYVFAARKIAKKVAYGSNPYLVIKKDDKETAYRITLPKRWARYDRIKKRRLIRHLPQPPTDSINFVRKDEGGLVVAKFDKVINVWIGTPTGWIKTKKDDRNRNAWLHLKDLGFPVPARKNKRIWNEKMEAYAIMKNI
ncbi:hypothetical protein [Thermicanus aegyptius]|uniref:hypothetical protein n=1 Tax=Thermicanus aegyptius TaxID=94009 RepID=UPI00040D3EB4|nr:hypothetical protein [Thermicanus aegyptius]